MKIKDNTIILTEKEASRYVKDGLVSKTIDSDEKHLPILFADIIKGQIEYELPITSSSIERILLSSSKKGKELINRYRYKVEMIMNGETSKSTSDSVEEAIMEMKPDFLHTEMYITISQGDRKYERKLNLIQGRKLFADETSREMFINNLI